MKDLSIGSEDAKHVVVARYIEKNIRAGVLRPGERIAGTRQLCSMFNTSAPVIKQAFDTLENRGLIDRFKRRGVFVSNTLKNNARRFSLLCDVPMNYRGNYYDALVEETAKRRSVVYPCLLLPQNDWQSDVNRMMEQEPDVVLIDLEGPKYPLDDLLRMISGTPCCFVSRWEWLRDPGEEHAVLIDYAEMTVRTLDYFLKRGNKKILYVSQNPELYEFEKKQFESAAERVGLKFPSPEFDFVFAYDFNLNPDRIIRCFSDPRERYTAIFCRSDSVLLNFINTVSLLYPYVWESDLVGMYDLFLSSLPGYEFSTWRMNYSQVFAQVMEHYTGDAGTERTVNWILPEFIERSHFTNRRKQHV